MEEIYNKIIDNLSYFRLNIAKIEIMTKIDK